MFRPTVAVILVGINDTLRKSFDASVVAVNLDRVVRALTKIGASASPPACQTRR